MNTIEMRGELGANGSVSEMSFHHIELAVAIPKVGPLVPHGQSHT